MTTKNLQIIEDLDLSTIEGGIYEYEIPGDYSKYDIISIQHEWESLTCEEGDTLNGTIDFEQKNSSDATLYSTVEEIQITMDAANDSSIQEQVAFGGSYIKIKVTLNDVTGGLLNSYLVAKIK